jgi:hypothetical protein
VGRDGTQGEHPEYSIYATRYTLHATVENTDCSTVAVAPYLYPLIFSDRPVPSHRPTIYIIFYFLER